jgi:integrase
VGGAWTDCGLVFVREDGAPLSPESISQRFERLCKRVGARRIRLHDLRHTAASLALADGVPVKVVSEMLGHGDVRVTLSIYQHTTAEMHVEAGARLTGRLLGDRRS